MQIAATSKPDLATFLLELALDAARRRKRLAEFLLAERTRRGGGDPERFPQPEMARELRVSLRTYQNWENGYRTPRPHNIETLLNVLDYDYYDPDGTTAGVTSGEVSPNAAQDATLQAALRRLERRVAQLEEQALSRAASPGDEAAPVPATRR